MSTNAVPGAVAANADDLAMGAWAEHADGSLIFVEGVEAGSVIYCIFDLAVDPPVEYRDSMPQSGFETQFSWPNDLSVEWTWHDKTPFPWERVMGDFRAGVGHSSASGQLSAAARVADSLSLRAGRVLDREYRDPSSTVTGVTIGRRLMNALEALAGR
jgi:hypothetical protein